MNSEIEKKLLSIRDLPTLPAVLYKLASASNNPNTDCRQIATLLQDDPVLSSRILRLVNSVLYAGTEPTASMQMAVARIGMTGIRNLATSVAVFQAFNGKTQPSFDRKEFWRHCILCGVAATILFRKTRSKLPQFYPDDVLHLSGLVHDIGRIVLDVYFHDAFIAAMTARDQTMSSLISMEQQFIGTDHAEVGAWLAHRWKMVTPVVQVIRWHHEPNSADPAYRELTELCNAANYICNFQQLGWSGDLFPIYRPALWEHLGLTPADVQEIGENIRAEGRDSQLLAALD